MYGWFLGRVVGETGWATIMICKVHWLKASIDKIRWLFWNIQMSFVYLGSTHYFGQRFLNFLLNSSYVFLLLLFDDLLLHSGFLYFIFKFLVFLSELLILQVKLIHLRINFLSDFFLFEHSKLPFKFFHFLLNFRLICLL